MSGVTVYGKSDCADTVRTREHLLALGVGYDYIDVEKDDEAAQKVEEWNGGKLMVPTVVLTGNGTPCDDRSILSVPGNTTLDVELDHHRLLPRADEGDGSIGM